MRIHLGCGAVYLRGFVNCDGTGVLAKNNPGLVDRNITTLDQYYARRRVGDRGQAAIDRTLRFDELAALDEAWEECVAVQCMEHATQGDAVAHFESIFRLLVSGGSFLVSVPDLIGTGKEMAAAEERGDLERTRFWMRHIYGSQTSPWMFHRAGWTAATLKADLLQVGFSSASPTDIIRHDYPALVFRAVK